MITLIHSSLEPLLYGLVIFAGLLSMVWKFKHGRWVALAIEIAVFALIFKLHGGTLAGGFAATIASALAGVIFPRMLNK